MVAAPAWTELDKQILIYTSEAEYYYFYINSCCYHKERQIAEVMT